MTLRDVKLIMPTVLILLFTVLIIITVIPYAFSSVIKQLKAVQAMEAAGTHFDIYLKKIHFLFSEAARLNASMYGAEVGVRAGQTPDATV